MLKAREIYMLSFEMRQIKNILKIYIHNSINILTSKRVDAP